MIGSMPSNAARAVRQKARDVVLVIFEQTKLLDVVGPLQVFNDALLEDGSPAYRVTLASETGGAVMTDAGVTLASERIDRAMVGIVDTMLISGGPPAVPAVATASLRACLRPHLKRPRRLGAI